jgi:hypothetical protein
MKFTPSIPAVPANPAVATDRPVPRPSTGTRDDEDEPEDEHDAENEAMGRERDDSTVANVEFERDDEDPS